MSDLEPGSQFGSYRIEHELGRGGMSIVYLAVEDSLSRTIALKIMAAHLHVDDSYRRRFNSEAHAAAAISHPNIVPIYSFGEYADRLYIAMQYIEGTDFRKYLEQHGPLTPAVAAAIVEQAAYALDAIHARGMTHRDIKPDNLLLAGLDRGTPHVYVADFGLTRAEDDEHLTSTGQILGTVTYAAPEQLLGEPVDGRADIYSLACVLFQAVTGSPPFVRNGSAAIIYAHVTDERPSACERNPSLPPAVDDVLKRGMAKQRDERYRTASEMLAAFKAAGEQAGPAGPPSVGPHMATPTLAPVAYHTTDPSVEVPAASAPASPYEGAPATTPPYGTAAPSQGGVPTFVPGSAPPAPTGSGPGKIVLIGAAVVVVLALIGGGVFFATRPSANVVTSATSPPASPTGSNDASPRTAGGSTDPSSGTTPEGGDTTISLPPKRAEILAGIDEQLVEIKRLHTRMATTYSGLAERCKITPEDAVGRNDDAVSDYQNVVSTLRQLEQAGDSIGEEVANDLRVAMERQITVEKERRVWLQAAIDKYADASPPGCPDGVVPTDENQANAEKDNVAAFSLKTEFANRYGAVSPNSVDPNDI